MTNICNVIRYLSTQYELQAELNDLESLQLMKNSISHNYNRNNKIIITFVIVLSGIIEIILPRIRQKQMRLNRDRLIRVSLSSVNSLLQLRVIAVRSLRNND